jgi:hypothetical protein
MSRMVCIFCFGIVILGDSSAAQNSAPNESSNTGPQFAIRADPLRAKSVNRLLAEAARPSETRIDKALSTREFLNERCGTNMAVAAAKRVIRRKMDHGDVLTFIPCVRFRTDVAVEVRSNDTLASIAVRLGVTKSNTVQFMRFRGTYPNWRRLDAKDKIREGDTVVVPEVPEWTVFETDQSQIANLGDLVRQLAKLLNCGRGDPNECLVARNVIAFQRRTTTPQLNAVPIGSQSPIQIGVPGHRIQTIIAPEEWSRRYSAPSTAAASPASAAPTELYPVVATAAANAAVADASVAVAAVDLVPPVVTILPAATAPSVLTISWVPIDQWPYDVELVKLALKTVVGLHPELRPTVVGVADGGLGSSDGKPLPVSVFTTTQGEPIYGYSGDVIGAGVARNAKPKNGDVGLCPPGYDSAMALGWPPRTLQIASHGAVVASIATGLPLRKEAALQNVLPALAFFRLSSSDCRTGLDLSFQPNDAFDAIQYLDTRASVVNVSYIDTSNNALFPYALKTELSSGGSDKLLVVPAGNDGADLDDLRQCPPCLANASWPRYDAVIGRRVLVIGGASRDLRPNSFSGSGTQTVYLYAPADAVGAVDILGNDATQFPAATSYAAPYAAMAAALLHSLGVTDLGDVAHRLRAASWPLVENGIESKGFEHVIIDLTKVAAVRSYAVEVLEHDATGSPVRRTYIGRLSQKLDSLTLCAGFSISENTVQAVRLGQADAAGNREVTIHLRKPGIAPMKLPPCHPEGTLLLAKLDGTMIPPIPMDSVSEILAPWMQ